MKYMIMMRLLDKDGIVAYKSFVGKRLHQLKSFAHVWAARHKMQVLETEWAELETPII